MRLEIKRATGEVEEYNIKEFVTSKFNSSAIAFRFMDDTTKSLIIRQGDRISIKEVLHED